MIRAQGSVRSAVSGLIVLARCGLLCRFKVQEPLLIGAVALVGLILNHD